MPVVVLILALFITNWIASEPLVLWPIALFRLVGTLGWIAFILGILGFVAWCLGGDRTPIAPVMPSLVDRSVDVDVPGRDRA